MYFENLENRRMLSAAVVNAALPPPHFPTTIASAAKVDSSNVAKQADKIDPNKAVNPAKLGGKLVEAPFDLVNIPLDPSQTPDLRDLSGTGLKSLLDSLGDGFLRQFAGKSIDQLTDLIGSASSNGSQRDLFDIVGADLASMRDTYKSARGDRTSQASVNLGVDLTSEEIAAAKAGNTSNNSGDEKKEEKSLLDKIIDFFTGGEKKDEKKTEVDHVVDQFTSPEIIVDVANGPVPAPISTALNGPGYVEKVTGDSKDLVNGFIAILQSGDKNPNMPKNKTPDPNSDDAALTPQQQQALNQFLALAARYMNDGPRLADQGTGLISQPGDDIVKSKPEKEQLPIDRIFSQKLAPYINPGTGDDGSGVDLGSGSGSAPAPTPIVKDPPKPDMVGTTPVTNLPPRNLPVGGVTPSTPDTPPSGPDAPAKAK